MARLRLGDIALGSKFRDKLLNSWTWLVVAHNADGEGITTLIQASAIEWHLEYDSAEPNNPNSSFQRYGNTSYEYSNILQWLNSKEDGNEWFVPQHATDEEPSYYSNPGFLNEAYFSTGFYNALVPVEKTGVTRRVHLAAWNEIAPNLESSIDSKFDTGISYGKYYIISRSDSSQLAIPVRPSSSISGAYIPTVTAVNRNFYSASSNEYRPNYKLFGLTPVIFMKSSTPVTYYNSETVYVGNYNNASVITVNDNLGQHKGEFDFTFKVSDADGDTVSVEAYIDDDSDNPIFNSTVSLDADTSVTVPASVMSGLEYGNHTISIIADDGDKTTTATSTFEKYDVAPAITVQSDMGQKKYAFNFSFQVSDTDDTKSAVTVKLDDKQIYSNDNAPINEDITVQIATADFSALSYDTHTLTITASDGIKTGTATATFQRIEISAPVITADEIGNKAETFSATYQVSSETADSINVVVKLDNAEIDNKTNVSQNTDIALSVSASRFNSLNYGEHTIAITATDNDGYSSTRTLVFKKCSIPTVRINGNIGQVESPFSVEVVANSADGGAVTVKAYIDGQEIER